MQYILRDYQKQAVNAGSELLHGTKRNGIIVLPTGAGKSLVIANIADQAAGHTLVLQPSKEILEQNYQKLLALGRRDVSIFSASLGIKQISHITLATIGSIHRKPELFAQFEQILVDECDLVNAKGGMYKDFFERIQRPVLGFTATPWRMHAGFQKPNGKITGSINKILTRTRPRVFEDIIHITQIHELYDQGYLTPIHYVPGIFDQQQLTLNSTGNDYSDATYKRISKNVVWDAYTAIRRSDANHNLIFTKFIKEADEISELLNNCDIPCAIVTGETKKSERESILTRFMSGDLKAVANVGVLTVGFDFPALDHIVLARPTNSARLYYQMLGRGIRLHPGKEQCTLTDLCGNVDRLGHIDDWILRDNNGDKRYRLYNGEDPLTGIDMKYGDDLEKPTTDLRNGNQIHFGKHKGKLMKDVPVDYLEWIVNNFSPGDFRNRAQDEIARRAVSNV